MPGLVGALPVPVTARYAGPVHVIRGGRSERVRNAELAVFAQYFPRFTLHTVLHGGHWPHAEAPEEFRACLAAALASDST
jgi:esterase